MINSTKEWHWMDDRSDIEHKLEGWGFDMDSLRAGEGAFLSLDRRSPRAFSTNVSNDPPTVEEIPAEQWCEYSGMPSPTAYIK